MNPAQHRVAGIFVSTTIGSIIGAGLAAMVIGPSSIPGGFIAVALLTTLRLWWAFRKQGPRSLRRPTHLNDLLARVHVRAIQITNALAVVLLALLAGVILSRA